MIIAPKISHDIDCVTIAYYDWLFSIFAKPFNDESDQHYVSKKNEHFQTLLYATKRCPTEGLEIIKDLIAINDRLSELSEEINSKKTFLVFKLEFLKFRGKLNDLKNLFYENRAQIDPLTKLNLRDSLNYLDIETKLQPQSQPSNFYVLFIDLDDFKSINDTYGHDAGDKVLKDVARILNDTLRDTDRLLRYGGEEFLAILEAHNVAEAKDIAQRILKNIEENVAIEDRKVTATIGISSKSNKESIYESITRADNAMYFGKKNGKNTFIYL